MLLYTIEKSFPAIKANQQVLPKHTLPFSCLTNFESVVLGAVLQTAVCGWLGREWGPEVGDGAPKDRGAASKGVGQGGLRRVTAVCQHSRPVGSCHNGDGGLGCLHTVVAFILLLLQERQRTQRCLHHLQQQEADFFCARFVGFVRNEQAAELSLSSKFIASAIAGDKVCLCHHIRI